MSYFDFPKTDINSLYKTILYYHIETFLERLW